MKVCIKFQSPNRGVTLNKKGGEHLCVGHIYVPAMGVILKVNIDIHQEAVHSFSPRNGEVILKLYGRRVHRIL